MSDGIKWCEDCWHLNLSNPQPMCVKTLVPAKEARSDIAPVSRDKYCGPDALLFKPRFCDWTKYPDAPQFVAHGRYFELPPPHLKLCWECGLPIRVDGKFL